MGYNSFEPDDEFGFAYWNFGTGDPIIEYDLKIEAWFSETVASISFNNEVLLLTNGMEIFRPSGERIIDTIAFLDGGENWNFYYSEGNGISYGFPKIQSACILPVPGHPDEYSILYYHGLEHPVYLFFGVVAVLEARLRRVGVEEWEVLYKDKVVLETQDFLSEGTWQACRHANGRDWWLLMHDYEGETYYRLFMDPDGIREVDTQRYPEAKNLCLNAWFSPDGSKYVKYVSGLNLKNFLYIYDFDRCTGLLSDRREIKIDVDVSTYDGMAVAANSRYVYVSVNAWELYQYDLLASDIQASQVLVDTNDGYVEPGWFNTTFGPMALAPDGRIYMYPVSGSSRVVHVIDRPDEYGSDAKLLQHEIMIQTSKQKSVQNFPNYRLGPLDGSPCDTLDIDNHPVSWWRHEVEAEDPLEIRFTDLSYFRPEVWEWDFGDGEISSEQHPIHTYPSPGLYYACLTVSNEYSSDSSCQWIDVMPVSVEDLPDEELFKVYPNPFTDYIEILPADGYHALTVRITDIHGRIVASPELACPCRLKLGDIPAGVYFYSIEEEGRVVNAGKILKL